MGAATTTVRGRRAVPWLVLGLWIAVLALTSPFASKLADVQRDRAVDYLPASADSTQVAKIQDRLPGGETTRMVVVYHRDGGLTAADRATAADQIGEIADAHPLTARPEGVPSKDGTTLMYPVASTEPGTDEEKRDQLVGDVRDIAQGEDGLSVDVGGEGALATDASEVYNSLDGPLLYTTAVVVALLLILIYRSPFLWLVPLAVAGIADYLSMGVAYGLNQGFGTSVSGQSSGIMTILVFGAGTDYALLLVSRYREELRRVRAALRRDGRRAEGLRTGGAGLLRDGRRGPVLPPRRRSQLQPGHGPAGHGRHPVRAGRHDDPAARDPRPARPPRLLAAGAALRQHAQGPPVAVRRDGQLRRTPAAD